MQFLPSAPPVRPLVGALALALLLSPAPADAQRVRGKTKASRAARAKNLGKHDRDISIRISEGAQSSKVMRGMEAIRAYRRFFRTDLVERDGKTHARLNPKKVQAEIDKSKAKDVTVKDVKRAWRHYRQGEKELREKNLGYRPPYKSLRVGWGPKHRKHVTRLSLADPGPEHRMITLVEPDIVKRGVIVHHEFINREDSHVQPYRPPDTVETTLVTYAAAAEAPVSVYKGLPNIPKDLQSLLAKSSKQKQFRKNPEALRELLRTPALEITDTAKARFSDGAAEVKVRLSPEQMPYASQMVQFMAEVNAQVGLHARDKFQILSAQFNLNEPIIDDLGGGRPKRISNPQSLAKLSLRILGRVAEVSKREGHANAWRKWAPDGAFPNPGTRVPFLELLGGMRPGLDKSGKPRTYTESQQKKFLVKGTKVLVDLVNRAHEGGLETYISAGMDESHMKWAAYTGVDGVGIGTALHERETKNGSSIMGKLSPEAIKKALDIRDQAEASALGRGARELYRLSFAKHRGKLKPGEKARHKKLLEAMKQLDEGKVEKILGSAGK